MQRSASAQDFPNYLIVHDQQGPNDQPSQVDLTQMGRDDTDADTYRLLWSWDSTTDWTGTGQTGDACALFDSDGDGNVNFVVCVRVENTNANPDSVTQEDGSPYAFTCSDAKNDRCTNPDPVDIDAGDVITGSIDPATGDLGLSTDNLITDTDPFPNLDPDQDWPEDTTIGIDILKSFLPTTDSVLINVCSYPSAGNGGNNNPFDCILRPGDGLMVIVKQTDQATTEPFDFTASNPGGSGIPAVSKDFTIVGAGQTATFGMTSGNGTTVTEDPETEWDLDSATCALEDGTPTGGSTLDGRGVESVTVNPGEVTTCTFVNSLITGAIDVEKTPDAGAVDAGQQIGFTMDVTNSGPGNATNVTLTDVLPSNGGLNWTIDAANSDAGCSIGGVPLTLTCNWGTLGDDASKSVHITSPTTAASCATINNTANVTTTESGTDQDCASVVVRCPNISITKTANIPSTVNAGELIGFVVTITNSGTGAATGLTFTDDLPNGLTWSIVAANTDPGWSINGSGDLVYAPTTLAGNSSTTVHVVGGDGRQRLRRRLQHGVGQRDQRLGGHADSATATATVNCPDIDIVKDADASPVSAGAQIGFTVTISNDGDGDATGLTFSDDLPNGLTWTIVAADSDPGWSIDGSGNLVYAPTTLAANSSSTVHVVATTDGGDCGTIPNTAFVNAANDNDPQDSDGASVVVNCPNLNIVKDADASPVNAGQQIGFTVTITNSGAGTATGLSFSDDLPDGLTWSIVAADSDAGWSLNGSNDLVYAPTTLAANSSTTVHVVATTDASDCGTVPNTAFVDATNDTAPQDSDGASVTVNCANLNIVKDADASPVNAGQQIGFTVTITNSGAGAATGLTFSDDLPNGLTWSIVAADTDAGWSLNGSNDLVYAPTSLAGNSSTTVHVVATTDGSDCGTVPNTAFVDATNDAAPQDSDGASVVVNCPNLNIVKDADASPVSAGDQIGFTVTITNSGAGTATGLSFSDDLPDGLTWSIVAADSDAGWSINGSGNLAYAPTSLAANSSTTVHVVATTDASDCATIPNTAFVDATNDTAPQDSDGASVTVDCPAIDVTKVADAASVSAGDQIGFVVTLINDGDGEAKDIQFTDQLPDGGGALSWSIVAADSDPGWSIVGDDLVYAPTTLAANSSSSVHVVATTVKEDCGTIDNTATLSASNDDTETRLGLRHRQVRRGRPDEDRGRGLRQRGQPDRVRPRGHQQRRRRGAQRDRDGHAADQPRPVLEHRLRQLGSRLLPSRAAC